MTDPAQTVTFQYDSRGRITQSAKVLDGTTYTTTSTYDGLGRLTSVSYPTNPITTVTYTYDGPYLKQVSEGATVYTTYGGWDAFGRPTSTVFGNGVNTTKSYSPTTFRILSINTTTPALDTLAPSIPSGLTATAVGSTQLNLSWTASTDNVGVTGYRVERCQGAGCTTFVQIATPTGTAFGDTGLAANMTYRYQVKAVDAAGNVSAASAIVTATSGVDTTAPSAPATLSVTAPSATQINLTWTASTDNVAVTGYLVERCQGAGCTNFAQVGAVPGLIYTDTAVTPNTTYRYQVKAMDAAGNISVASPIGSATPPADTTAPSVPSGVTATVSGISQINLSWTASTDNVGVTDYRVERCQGVGCTTFAQIGTSTSASFNDTGLTANTTYCYQVKAADAAGNVSAASAIITATTATDTTAPSVPSGLTATAASSTQINLSWTASTDNVAVTGYAVERCQGAGCTTFIQIGTPTGTTFTDTGLTASTSYSYRVRATDAANNLSGYSTLATATTPVGTTLITAWGMNEGSGTTLTDSSGSGHTGTLVNGPAWVAGQVTYGQAGSSAVKSSISTAATN